MNFLKKGNLFLSSVFIVLIHLPFVFAKSVQNGTVLDISRVKKTLSKNDSSSAEPLQGGEAKASLYDSLKLGAAGLSKQVFDYAMKGFAYLKEKGSIENTDVVSIVDFSKPSYEKRFIVIDIKNFKVLFNTYVAHGMNSGKEFANQFSNLPESNKSSLGFYITSDTYIGKHGYSLHLNGVEKGINDNAYRRDIVIHGADYVSEANINEQGYIGRSLGCPALPEKLHKPIIEKIKNGTCLFIFGPDKKYISHSRIINSTDVSGIHSFS